jgi:hypothetical protein
MTKFPISPRAQRSISDLLDNWARIKPGQEVLLMAHTDGLYGSDNLVDATAMDWLQSAIVERGATPSMLWINEPDKPHDWGIPRVLKEAMRGADVFINHSFRYVTEENRPLRDYFTELGVRYIRNFATTVPLLESDWALTPAALVAEIRHSSSAMIEVGAPFVLTDPLGTHLEGSIAPPQHRWFPTYASRREEGGGYLPWPEWVFPPINLASVNGIVVFDRMLSWWSRYIGISPFFKEPVTVEVNDSLITRIEGGEEAAAIKRFVEYMEKERGVTRRYEFNTLHSGVHPHAHVTPEQCPNIAYRRMIEHAHTSNIHMHLGAEHGDKKNYPYWLHITGDIRRPTWKVGDKLLHEDGYLTALNSPEVRAVAAHFPDAPPLPTGPAPNPAVA